MTAFDLAADGTLSNRREWAQFLTASVSTPKAHLGSVAVFLRSAAHPRRRRGRREHSDRAAGSGMRAGRRGPQDPVHLHLPEAAQPALATRRLGLVQRSNSALPSATSADQSFVGGPTHMARVTSGKSRVHQSGTVSAMGRDGYAGITERGGQRVLIPGAHARTTTAGMRSEVLRAGADPAGPAAATPAP